MAESKRGGGQMSSVQLLESWGSSVQQGQDGFCKHIMCRTWKPSDVPLSASKPKFSLLEASRCECVEAKTTCVCGGWGSASLPCFFASWAFLHLCIPAISVSLHPGHLWICVLVIFAPCESLHFTILGVCISASWHLPIPGVEAAGQESRGSAPPAQLGLCRVSARAAESSSSQMLSFLSKSLAASFS